MSLYSEYLAEKENKEYFEIPNKGFITYRIIPENKECYIDIIFVKKEFRKQKIGKQLEQEVIKKAKESGCTFLSAQVYSKAPFFKDSLAAIIKSNYAVFKEYDNYLLVVKNI